jgi:hypothetical protein
LLESAWKINGTTRQLVRIRAIARGITTGRCQEQRAFGKMTASQRRRYAMACVHLKKLYRLCQEEGLRISSSDLVHFACDQCKLIEVCPSTLVDLREPDDDESSTAPAPGPIRDRRVL